VVVRVVDTGGLVRVSGGQEVYFALDAVRNGGFVALDIGSSVELTVAKRGRSWPALPGKGPYVNGAVNRRRVRSFGRM
jgi:cold shock CspA family protein